MSIKFIRNFSIIAHIDHGKSSLADCFLEWTQAVDDRTKKDRFLDSMDLERERGITIKAQTVRLNFKYDPSYKHQTKELPARGLTDSGMAGSAGVKEQAEMAGSAGVKEQAEMAGSAGVKEQAEMTGSAGVIEQAEMTGSAGVKEQAEMAGSAGVIEQAEMTGSAGLKKQAEMTRSAGLDKWTELSGKNRMSRVETDKITSVEEYNLSHKEENINRLSKDEMPSIKKGVYQLNLIDTPGHVDFSYEVSRSLSACEGALLVVDACQGIEAQTMANTLLALENNLEIIPVINKIDLPSQRIEEVKRQLVDLIGVKEEEILLASAKEKIGIQDILAAVVERVPPPEPAGFSKKLSAKDASSSAVSNKELKKQSQVLRALIFDSWFDSYQGVIALCRIKQGVVKKGDKIFLKGTDRECEVLQLGVFTPFPTELEELRTGEVGFVITGIKEIADMKVGDTITYTTTKSAPALEGFKESRPMVYAGIFPTSSDEFEALKKALEKLSLNDSSLTFEMESSKVLGFGFRCGFLGLLHKEIVQERLEREFELALITTAPSVIYKTYLKNGEVLSVENPSLLPDPAHIDRLEEPLALAQIHTPAEYIGALLKLCEEKRGVQQGIEYISSDKSILKYKIPLNEMILDFHDRLKSLSRGYASMDYELGGYESANLVKMDVLLNGEIIDALSVIVHRNQAEQKGRYLAKRLKELIPRQQFQVAIQAAIGAKIIARETLGAYRKDVTAKLYGGDVTRKKKLLEKQKSGKKRMKAIGKIEVPQKAFMALMKTDH